MKMDMNRVVVVASVNGEKFVGMVDEGIGPTDLMEAITDGRPVDLVGVRNYIAQMKPNIGPRGEVLGMQSFAAFLPVDVMDGPMERMSVRVSHHYWVRDNPAMVEKMKRLFAAAEGSEVRLQAQESGLAIP